MRSLFPQTQSWQQQCKNFLPQDKNFMTLVKLSFSLESCQWWLHIRDQSYSQSGQNPMPLFLNPVSSFSFLFSFSWGSFWTQLIPQCCNKHPHNHSKGDQKVYFFYMCVRVRVHLRLPRFECLIPHHSNWECIGRVKKRGRIERGGILPWVPLRKSFGITNIFKDLSILAEFMVEFPKKEESEKMKRIMTNDKFIIYG